MAVAKAKDALTQLSSQLDEEGILTLEHVSHVLGMMTGKANGNGDGFEPYTDANGNGNDRYGNQMRAFHVYLFLSAKVQREEGPPGDFPF